MFTLSYFSIPGWLDLFVYSVAFTHWHPSFALWIEIFILHVEPLLKKSKAYGFNSKRFISCSILRLPLRSQLWGLRGWTRSRWHHTLWHPAQSCRDDRPASSVTPVRQVYARVCVWLCQVPVLTEDGDEGQDGWSMTGKNNHLKFITYCLCCCLCSLCSESSGHDDHHRRLGLANVSLTWGKNKLSAEVFVWV